MRPRSNSSRRNGRARLAVALAAAGAIPLLLPAVASASTGHSGGGSAGLLSIPMGSIFSDILGPVLGFGKDVLTSIIKGLLSLLFGGSWKILLHPFEIVQWLIGLPGTGNTTAFVPIQGVHAGPFQALLNDTRSIGLGLLPLALGYNVVHLVSGGMFTRPRDHMHDFGKVFMAACAILAWPWLFGQAIDLANTVTLAMLNAANAGGNIYKAVGAVFTTAYAGGFLDLLTSAFVVATAMLLVGLIVMKIVMMVALAFIMVIGPIAIAFYPFEFLSRLLMLFGTVFLGLALIPLGWAVLFALFGAFGASMLDLNGFFHAGLIGGMTKTIFDLICCLICFWLAWKWPFLILGRITSLVGGGVAEMGQALSAVASGRGVGAAGRGAAAAAGIPGGGAEGGSGVGGGAGMLESKLASFRSGAETLGNAVGAATTRLPFYGAAGGLATAAAGRVGQRLGTKGAAATGDGAATGAQPLAAAVANGGDAGFEAVKASGRDFTDSPTSVARQAAALAATSSAVPGAATSGGASGTPTSAVGGDDGAAAVSASPNGTATAGPDRVAEQAAAISRQSSGAAAFAGQAHGRGNGSSQAAPATTHDGATSAPAQVEAGVGAAGAVHPAGALAQGGTPAAGSSGAAAADPRQVLQTAATSAAAIPGAQPHGPAVGGTTAGAGTSGPAAGAGASSQPAGGPTPAARIAGHGSAGVAAKPGAPATRANTGRAPQPGNGRPHPAPGIGHGFSPQPDPPAPKTPDHTLPPDPASQAPKRPAPQPATPPAGGERTSN